MKVDIAKFATFCNILEQDSFWLKWHGMLSLIKENCTASGSREGGRFANANFVVNMQIRYITRRKMAAFDLIRLPNRCMEMGWNAI